MLDYDCSASEVEAWKYLEILFLCQVYRTDLKIYIYQKLKTRLNFKELSMLGQKGKCEQPFYFRWRLEM